jgi:hypothetical protein
VGFVVCHSCGGIPCLLCAYDIFFRIFRCLPFLSVLITWIVSVMLPYTCPVFSIWLEYPELLLLHLMSRMCSLHLVLNDRPVCPMYFNGQLKHFIWYTPLSSYLSVAVFDLSMLCIAFLVLKAIFMCVFLKSLVIFLVSFMLTPCLKH